MEPLLTTEEVAEYLRVEVVTVRRLITRGELPAYRIGGEFRFTASDVEGFVKGQRVTAKEAVDVFGKFTERARKVLSFANQEAGELNHSYIGTEHLLLGLVREGEGVAARALIRSGHNLQDVHQRTMEVIEAAADATEKPMAQIKSAVQGVLGKSPSPNPPGERGMTGRAKKVIELGVEEARRMGHHYIGTEHLLLGILREGGGLAADVLIEGCGLKFDAVRDLVLQILQETPTMVLPEIPELAATLLDEQEQGVVCGRCSARSPEYFRYCFHCGLSLQ